MRFVADDREYPMRSAPDQIQVIRPQDAPLGRPFIRIGAITWEYTHLRFTPPQLEDALPGQVLLVDCANPRAAQNALANLQGISAMAQIGASLRVLGSDAADLRARIATSLHAADIDARVEATRPNLEDVFVAATRQAPAPHAETHA